MKKRIFVLLVATLASVSAAKVKSKKPTSPTEGEKSIERNNTQREIGAPKNHSENFNIHLKTMTDVKNFASFVHAIALDKLDDSDLGKIKIGIPSKKLHSLDSSKIDSPKIDALIKNFLKKSSPNDRSSRVDSSQVTSAKKVKSLARSPAGDLAGQGHGEKKDPEAAENSMDENLKLSKLFMDEYRKLLRERRWKRQGASKSVKVSRPLDVKVRDDTKNNSVEENTPEVFNDQEIANEAANKTSRKSTLIESAGGLDGVTVEESKSAAAPTNRSIKKENDDESTEDDHRSAHYGNSNVNTNINTNTNEFVVADSVETTSENNTTDPKIEISMRFGPDEPAESTSQKTDEHRQRATSARPEKVDSPQKNGRVKNERLVEGKLISYSKIIEQKNNISTELTRELLSRCCASKGSIESSELKTDKNSTTANDTRPIKKKYVMDVLLESVNAIIGINSTRMRSVTLG